LAPIPPLFWRSTHCLSGLCAITLLSQRFLLGLLSPTLGLYHSLPTIAVPLIYLMRCPDDLPINQCLMFLVVAISPPVLFFQLSLVVSASLVSDSSGSIMSDLPFLCFKPQPACPTDPPTGPPNLFSFCPLIFFPFCSFSLCFLAPMNYAPRTTSSTPKWSRIPITPMLMTCTKQLGGLISSYLHQNVSPAAVCRTSLFDPDTFPS